MGDSMLDRTLPGDVQGAMTDLREKLGGRSGPVWSAALKLFLRQENPWDNPFQRAPLEQVRRLREQFAVTFGPQFGFREPRRSTILHLDRMAPDWPEGRDGFRSLRIRFGTGSEGVQLTAAAHLAAIRQVHGDIEIRTSQLAGVIKMNRGSIPRLSMQVGPKEHRPTIEWITIPSLSARLNTKLSTDHQRPVLADEGLVLAWLAHERAMAIDYGLRPGWFCAGYLLASPGDHGRPVFQVPGIARSTETGKIVLHSYECRSSSGSSSIPFFRQAEES